MRYCHSCKVTTSEGESGQCESCGKFYPEPEPKKVCWACRERPPRRLKTKRVRYAHATKEPVFCSRGCAADYGLLASNPNFGEGGPYWCRTQIWTTGWVPRHPDCMECEAPAEPEEQAWGAIEKITMEDFLAQFPASRQDVIAGAAARLGAVAVVMFENVTFDSSEFGRRSALLIGPEFTYKSVEECEGKWLYDLPSQRQYPMNYAKV